VGGPVLQYAQDRDLRRIERGAAQHRGTDGARLTEWLMDFSFSDEQEQLRDAVRKWVGRRYGFERRRAIAQAGGFDRGAYEELAGLGLTGLLVADEFGGMGMGPVDAMVVLEELGQGAVLEPLGQTFVASGLLGAWAPQELQAQ